MFKRILIANRGEIACRIIQSCRRLGIQTIAISSEIDKDALHMGQADRAVVMGPPLCYLDGPGILKVALQEGAEAIHPGYGFLSENAEFAESIRQAGLVFVGPPTRAIRMMGSKSQAKELAKSIDVPVIPGYEGNELEKAAQGIGFPLLIKATYGGGGKGMRLVSRKEEFSDALTACQREAETAFGKPQVILEKYLEHPRHIEVQILADSFGNCYVLSDRDCSLQRRYQKVVEEAPALNVPAILHEAARRIALTAGYEGAGTVEFLVDPNGKFYFLEMNTRLQVEHPVTEMVLCLDLVEWQLRIAAGEKVSLKTLEPHGHAIEVRLYAEDSDSGFLPSPGTITRLWVPEEEHIRIDTGVREGDEVSSYYDPMIAKMIAWGEDRADALNRLEKALCSTDVMGVKTNLKFLNTLMNQPAVIKGRFSIDFIDSYLIRQGEAYLLAALFLYQEGRLQAKSAPWLGYDGWRLGGQAEKQVFSFRGGKKVTVFPDPLYLEEGGNRYEVSDLVLEEHKLVATIDGRMYEARCTPRDHHIRIQFQGFLYEIYQEEAAPEAISTKATQHLRAPMPGRIVSVLVNLNDIVTAGQPLIILEAMKMEHTIVAPYAGVVDNLPFGVGDFCEEGAELVRIKQ